MKFWYYLPRLIGALGYLTLTAIYVYTVTLIHRYWEVTAIENARNSRAYSGTCPLAIGCEYAEVPVKVNTATEIVIPTILCSGVIFAVIVIAIVWAVSTLRSQPKSGT